MEPVNLCNPLDLKHVTLLEVAVSGAYPENYIGIWSYGGPMPRGVRIWVWVTMVEVLRALGRTVAVCGPMGRTRIV
jgi:hypothetical protein